MLGSRVATAGVLLGIFLAAFLLASPRVWAVLCALAILPAAWEWGRLAHASRLANAVFAAFLALAVLLLAAVPGLQSWTRLVFAIATAFWVIGAPLWLWRKPAVSRPLLMVLGAIVLVAAFGALAQFRETGSWLLIAIMAVVWVSDTAAFFCGRRFGRHKLAPSISPAKTWEGVWGALISVAVYAGILIAFFPAVLPATYRGAAFVAAALVLAILGIVGDLFESQMKRYAGVKDSGSVLPGHGGILDRIDALMPVLAAAALLFGQ